MARTNTITLIPIDRVARHLGVDPYHFNGIQGTYAPKYPRCDDMWLQHDWQSAGQLSSEALAFALRQAEDVVMEHLHWSPVPQWFEEEVSLTPYYKVEAWTNWNSRGQPKSLFTRWGMVVEPGRKASTYIDTPSIVWVNNDGDTFTETAQITFATTVTDEQELRVFYPGESGEASWEIRPLNSVTIAAGVATIEFPRYLIPLWDLVEALPTDDDPHVDINGDLDANFLDEVDVYRVYTDVSQQATFYYDPSQSCAGVPCDLTGETGCLFIRDARRGILAYQRSDWNSTTESYDSAAWTYGVPYKATIYYRAGKQDSRQMFPKLQMDEALERMISFYALSLLDTELCGCDNTKKIWQYMTADLAEIKESNRFMMSWNALDNPLGTTRAAMRLWKHIQPLRFSPAPMVF